MKKIFLSFLFLAMILAIGGAAQAQDLEKISSPDQIKNFKIIKREGNALFGVRLIEKASSTNSVMEKIPHPGEIKNFDKIKKIGATLWGFRKIEIKKPVLIKPVAVQCVKNAIDKKDTALKSAITTHSQTVLNSLDTRNACQKSALDKTTAQEQLNANRSCVESYKKSIKDNNKILEKARSEAWSVYKTDLKTCAALQKEPNVSATAEEIVIDDGEEIAAMAE